MMAACPFAKINDTSSLYVSIKVFELAYHIRYAKKEYNSNE